MSLEEDKKYLEDVKNSLTIEQVSQLLAELGGDPQLQGNIIKSRTICHCGNSHKLYYYNNTKLFKCFTDCDSTWDIFQLILKLKKNNNIDWNLYQAVDYIANYFNLAPRKQKKENLENELKDWQILNKYINNNNLKEENKQIIEFKKYDNKILKYLPHPRIVPWEKEGITREVMEACGICYNPSSQGIVIPHYNENNELIGIRERTLIKENEVNGKYRSAIINRQMYNHPLGFSLYGLNWSKEQIKKIKKAIIFEGEKSHLLYASYFGIENNISVACCGSSLSNYQVQLLLDLGVEEIVIAFDKQFKEINDEEWKRWVKKLTDIDKKYSSKVKVSFMFDKWNLLEYKDSPIDKGKDVFLELFKRRISL